MYVVKGARHRLNAYYGVGKASLHIFKFLKGEGEGCHVVCYQDEARWSDSPGVLLLCLYQFGC